MSAKLLENKKLTFLMLVGSLLLAVFLNFQTYNELIVSENLANKFASIATKKRAEYLKDKIEKAEIKAGTIRNTIVNLSEADMFNRALVSNILYSSLNTDTDLLSIWMYSEPNVFDKDSLFIGTDWSTDTGRFAPWFYYDRSHNSIIKTVCSSDQQIFYELPKKLNRSVLIEPYTSLGGGEETYFITLSMPIIENGFKGVLGVDWIWEDFNKLMCAKPYGKKGNSFITNEKGIILAHENESLLGTKVPNNLVTQLPTNSDAVVQENLNINEEGIYRIVSVLDIPYTQSKWYLVNEIPTSNELFATIKSRKLIWRVVIFFCVLLIFLVFIVSYLINKLTKDSEKIRNQLVSVLGTTYEGVYAVDRDFNYLWFNDSFKDSMQKILGIALYEGDSAFEKLPIIYQGGLKENFQRAIDGSFFIHDKSHAGRRYRQYYNPILNEFKEVEGVTVRIVDITDQLKDQEELEDYRENLEKLILERTIDLRETITKLKDTRLKLIENEKIATLGLLSSGLADEISSPMNFIVGNITPLKRDIAEVNSMIRYVDSISEEKESSSVKDIKNYMESMEPEILIPEINTLVSDIETGTYRVKEIVMNFNEFVRPDRQARFENINRGITLSLEFLKSKTRSNITISTNLDPELPSTYCDMGKINDSFLTLIGYSIDAVKESGEIIINTSHQDDLINIKISNNGRKLSQEDIEFIFDPAFSVRDINSDEGVGLALCYKIIEAHGGKMKISNNSKQGFAFYLQIPVLLGAKII